MQLTFGAGDFFAVPLSDAQGNAITNPTPIQIGAMQEMSLTSFWIIAGSCVLVLGIMILKNRARFALNFLVRAVLGACAIACVNKWLAQQGIMLAVGINPVTLLTTGSLGFSGVALLYGILLLKIL